MCHRSLYSSPVQLPTRLYGVDDEDSDLFSAAAIAAPTEEETEEAAKKLDILQVKQELLSLAKLTKRGFDATRSQRKFARDLIDTLAKYNPTEEPAAAYYTSTEKGDEEVVDVGPSLVGKWTLVYTDAPDITSLDAERSFGPFAASKLGRIGQECSPPFIKNVIEWVPPEWAKNFSFGKGDSRVLQKVCCEGIAKKEHPTIVDLQIVGLDLLGFSGAKPTTEAAAPVEEDEGEGAATKKKDSKESVAKLVEGGPASFFEENPVELRGPLKAPFGRFEILYLDEELRVIRTNQGYVAVNKRERDAWF